MEDVEKLSCREVMENSDLDNSATEEPRESGDKPRRKRRRREVYMEKLSDIEEEDSDADGSPRKRTSSPIHREIRSCVLKSLTRTRPLCRLLEALLHELEWRDPEQHFAWPVDDAFAPNYSKLIRRPMDFSTMRNKIQDDKYRSLTEFVDDFRLMCENAMKYNKAGTVYHRCARRLLQHGLRQLTPQKLRQLAATHTYLYEIPLRELGFDIGKMDAKLLKRGYRIKSSSSEPDLEAKLDAEERGDEGANSVKIKMDAAREKHRRKLAKKAFPRMDATGTTTLSIATCAAGEAGVPPLRQLLPKLRHGTGTLHIPREDRRNLVKGVTPLRYGAFNSHAPTHDSTFATLTRDESHLLYHTLPCELGQSNEETLRFAEDSPWRAIYDMEELFPERSKQPAPPPAPAPEPERVDVPALGGLEALGVDMGWLREVAPALRDYGIAAALRHTATLLHRLQRQQHDRLSVGFGWHLSLARGAGAGEQETARQVAACLRAMAARVPPKALVSVPALRAAMGVTMDHLDTPMALDELELELTSETDCKSSHDK